MASAWSLAGKTCVVTGANGSIGRATCVRFAQEGARVILVGRRQADLDDALKQVQRAGPPAASETVHEHRAIVFDTKELQQWKDKVQTEVHVLVSCAGMAQERLLVRTECRTIDEILAVNLRSAIVACQFMGKHMPRNQGCSIVNISSLLATRGKIGTSVYAASKAALLGLTSSLAVEYSKSFIRVNAIVPGYIHSDMTRHLKASELGIPLHRFGRPEEVADAAAFLAKNQYANNCILNLDGGLSAGTS